MHTREEVTVKREVGAIQIPDGTPVVIPEGTRVVITQQLGGSYTVTTELGAMLRIDERNADAIGKEAPSSEAEATTGGGQTSLEEQVWDQMKKCYDPEIPVNVVELGLVYDCQITELPDGGNRVTVKMTLTAPGCGMGPVLAEDVRSRLEQLPGISEATVEVVLDPPWNPGMMSEAARLQLGFM